MAVTDYDTNPANNVAISGIDVSEGCSPAGINNAIRQMMADVASLRAELLDEARYKVGDLYLSTTTTNPAVTLGYGTWAAHAAGRALVGVGTSGTADAYAWTAGQERGLETHTIDGSEIPPHSHAAGSLTATCLPSGEHSHNTIHTEGGNPFGYSAFATGNIFATTGSTAGNKLNALTSVEAAHTHAITMSGQTDAWGGDGVSSNSAHNNLQPSIAVYVWRRTA